MRLKTKIILICCISTLFSCAFCSVAVYGLVKRISLEAAEGQSLKNVTDEISQLEDRMNAISNDMRFSQDKEVLQYILKQHNDDFLVCFSSERDGEEIYNVTVFKQRELNALEYRYISEPDLKMAQMEWEDQHFFVYNTYIGDMCVIYKLEDITYVWERMGLLGFGLVVLTCIITMGVCLLLFIVLNKVLFPLQQLNDGAKQIARGRYDERIQVGRKDEIGELSENFNQMAGAVQFRIEKLKEAEWKRTLFMGNLTHELKTPMTAISGYARTLLTVKLPEEDREEALSYIYEESCRLERLSRKMMDLLLLEENNNICFEKVAAGILFHRAAEACSQSLEQDGIRLECQEKGEVFLVDVDLFTEVLINLVDNARKASQRGDRIILSASGNRICVRDFGTGIPEEEKERILEPFYMIDKSRSRKSGGAGLGLAITAMILKRHNCGIQIESEVGQGTQMILQFV